MSLICFLTNGSAASADILNMWTRVTIKLVGATSGSQHKNLCKIEKEDFHTLLYFPISMFKHIKETVKNGSFFCFPFSIIKTKNGKWVAFRFPISKW